MAKNRGRTVIVKLLKHHILNCVLHEECVAFRHNFPEEFNIGGVPGGLGREFPRDDPIALYPAPVESAAQEDTAAPPPPKWPLKHFGKVFRAASEGDFSLLKKLILDWNQSQEFAEEEDEGLEAQPQDGSIQPVDKRPDPVTAQHPTTGETLLHYAARQSSPAMVKYLIARGCDATVCDKWGTTPFWYACDYGRFENAQLLAAKLNLRELRRPQGRTQESPAHAAQANRHAKLATWIQEEVTRRLKKR